jgi:hypothetical protein
MTRLHSTIPTPYFLSPEQDPTLYVASYEPTSQIPSWNRSTFEQLHRAETDIRTVVTYSLERRSQTFLLTWIPFPLNPLHKRFHPHLPVPQHTYHTPFVPYLTQTPVFHLISSRSPSHRIPWPRIASPRIASPLVNSLWVDACSVVVRRGVWEHGVTDGMVCSALHVLSLDLTFYFGGHATVLLCACLLCSLSHGSLWRTSESALPEWRRRSFD